jgi:hypothetical protein
MLFPASYDRTTKIISGVVCLFLLALAIAIHNLIADCLALVVLLGSIAWSPRGYAIQGKTILVKRLAGTVGVALDDVREARRATREDFSGCVRLWGSGGLFGYYGIFSTTKLGKSTWYVTNRKNAVVVITPAKTALFSPDNPDAFLTALQATTPIPEWQAGQDAEVQPRRSAGKLVVAAAILAAIGLWIWVLTYSPGVPGYTLTPEELTIHDRYYPVTLQASSVDVDGIRIVDLTRDTEWRPRARTNGVAVVHYRSGWFRVESGAQVRLYQADGRQLVLLPPKGDGTPVLYQAMDPGNFVQQIRAVWSVTARNRSNAGKWFQYAL